MSFEEVLFPTDISFGSKGGAEFSTDVTVTAGGFEKRNSNWANARAKYNIAYGIRKKSQLDTLIAFFRARKGRAIGFRFKDWSDFDVTGEILGIGNGIIEDFQLIKSYQSGAISQVRDITKPVSGTIAIYKDAVLQASGFSVDTATGIVNFVTAPSSAEVITADFEFDVPVRFDTDKFTATMESLGKDSVQNIGLVEVRI